jgi:peptide/nickel transport system permease protein
MKKFAAAVKNNFLANPLASAGLLFLAALFALALFGPLLPLPDALAQNVMERLKGPSPAHLLGTDDLGRDILARIISGARISLSVGVVAVGISLVIGTLVGLLAGYFGGWVDALLMRLVDLLLCFPTIFLILMVIAFLEPDIKNIMAVIGLTSWMGLARLVRAECLSLRERDFVTAARGLGLSHLYVIARHILPNVLTPILITATLGVGGAILTESALSFLGLGVQPPTPSWGNMLTLGKDYIHMAWWLSVFPGLAILATVLAFNLLGEALRDWFDPRQGSRP